MSQALLELLKTEKLMHSSMTSMNFHAFLYSPFHQMHEEHPYARILVHMVGDRPADDEVLDTSEEVHFRPEKHMP